MALFQVTYTFVANTKARSSEVNQNYTDVLNILKAHHHDPNIYTNASPITNSGIAANAQILATQLQYNITLSGLINPLALQVVTVPKGGLGLMSVAAGDTIYGDSTNVYRTLPIGTSGQVKTVVAGKPSWQDPPPSIFNYFGDGSDGNATISGDTNMSRDMYYNDLTINGGNLCTNGYKLFVKGTLTVANGYKVHNNAAAGTAGGNGPGTGGGRNGGNVGPGAAAGTTGTVYGGAAGKDGGRGGNGGNGAAGNNGDVGATGAAGAAENVSLTQAAGIAGATGGNGGNNTVGSGGAGGVAGALGAAGSAPVFGTPHTWLQLFRWLDPTTSVWAAFAHYKGASQSTGGGGGGGGACNESTGNEKGSGGGGGGGGATAGVCWIAAYAIVNNGTLECKGGAGGNGGNADNASVLNGNGGGGGGGGGGAGGGGGILLLIYHSLSGSGSTSVAGGTGGTGGALGTKVGGGSNGTVGGNGSNGNAGAVLSYTV